MSAERPAPTLSAVLVNDAIHRAHCAINDALMFAPPGSDSAANLRDASLSLTAAAVSNMECK